jgi:chromosome segregation ATPase
MTVGGKSVRVDGTITLGNIMIVGTLLGLLLPGTWIAQGYMRQTEDTARKQTEMQADAVKAQAEIKAEMKAGFAQAQSQLTEAKTQIQQQIGNLPDQAARLSQVERAITDLRQSDRDTISEIGRMKDVLSDTKARVDQWENVRVRQTR